MLMLSYIGTKRYNMIVYRHKNNRDIAAEVLKMIKIPNKDYIKIKVRWWNIGPHDPYCMNIVQWLTTTEGKNMDERRKYPREKWKNEWIPYDLTGDFHDQLKISRKRV